MDFLNQLKQYDIPQSLSVLFAPSDLKNDISLLYLCYYHWHHIFISVSDPVLAQVKITWWHDMLCADNPPHNVPDYMHALYDMVQKNPDLKPYIDNVFDGLTQDYTDTQNIEYHARKAFIIVILKLHNITDTVQIDNILHATSCQNMLSHKHIFPRSIRHIFIPFILKQSNDNFISKIKNIFKIFILYIK